MSSNLIIYLLSLLFICFDFENVLLIYAFFFTFLTLDIRDSKSRLGQTAKALGLVSPFNTFYYIRTQKLDCEQSLSFLLSHSGPIAQSTREGRAAKSRGTRVI